MHGCCSRRWPAVETFTDVVPSDVGVVEDRLAVAVSEDVPLADQIAAVGDFERLADVVVGQQDSDVVARPRGCGSGPESRSTVFGSMPANGSSSMMSFGSVISERAISSRRRSPPETRFAFVLRMWVRPNWSSSSFWRSLRCCGDSCRGGFRGSPSGCLRRTAA